MAESFVVPLKKLFWGTKKNRAKKAVREIKRFLAKHKRLKEAQIEISQELNEFLWKNGIYGIPKKVEIELMEEEEKTVAFLKGGKEAKERAEQKKKKEKAKEKEKEEKKEAKEEEKEKKEEEKKEERKEESEKTKKAKEKLKKEGGLAEELKKKKFKGKEETRGFGGEARKEQVERHESGAR